MAEGRSAWAYARSGCLTLVLLAAALVVGGGFWLHRDARSFKRTLADPVERAARVRNLLGVEAIPDGYHAVLAFKIPFRRQVAVLSDREPALDGWTGGLGERGLIYLLLHDGARDRSSLRGFFEERPPDPARLSEMQVELEMQEILSRGQAALEDASLRYLVERGSVTVEGFRGEGLIALTLVDCPDDRWGRLAIWFVPDPAPGLPLVVTDLLGTPADAEAITAFLGRFRFCGAAAS